MRRCGGAGGGIEGEGLVVSAAAVFQFSGGRRSRVCFFDLFHDFRAVFATVVVCQKRGDFVAKFVCYGAQ